MNQIDFHHRFILDESGNGRIVVRLLIFIRNCRDRERNRGGRSNRKNRRLFSDADRDLVHSSIPSLGESSKISFHSIRDRGRRVTRRLVKSRLIRGGKVFRESSSSPLSIPRSGSCS